MGFPKKSYKLLGGKNCLFYAITVEGKVFNVYLSDGAKEQLKKDFNPL
jgi:hypothetical protein